MGLASIDVPSTDNRKGFSEQGLSNDLAMSYGTLFARTLLERDGYVHVALSDGTRIVIGCDTVTGKLVMGHLFSDY